MKFCAIYFDVAKLRPEVDAQINSFGFDLDRQIAKRIPDRMMRVDGGQLEMNIAARDVGQIEQFVNETDQDVDVATNERQARPIQFRRGLDLRHVRQVLLQFQYVEHRRDGAERSSQFVRKSGQEFVFCFVLNQQRGQVRLRHLLHFRAVTDIADIALNDLLAIDQVNVAHELDLDLLSVLRNQGKVFIPDVLGFL